MIESVRQYEGMILKTQMSASPTAYVELISLRITATIAPIPAMTKCRKIVTV
jgi:hypothetical protein